MSNKTPYEIRLELLQLSNGILSDRMFGERNRLENDWNMQREEWHMKAANGEFSKLPPFPDMPAVNEKEIIDLAKKLNDFVSNG